MGGDDPSEVLDCEGLDDFLGAIGSCGRFVSRGVMQAGSCTVQRLKQEAEDSLTWVKQGLGELQHH